MISAWCWLTSEGEAVLSWCISIITLTNVVQIATIDDTNEELRNTHTWDSLNRDGIGSSHVHLHEPVVLVLGLIGEADISLTKFNVLIIKLFLILPSCRCLTECEHVEDVLALRQEIVEAEVRSQSYVIGANVATVEIISIDDNGIVVVMQACVEMLGIGIPSGVEEHSVEHDVSEEHASSVLFAGPPWLERVEALAILIGNVRKLVCTVSNWNGLLQLLIISWSEQVLESNQDLRVDVTVHREVDWLGQVNCLTGIQQNLVDWLQEARLQ